MAGWTGVVYPVVVGAVFVALGVPLARRRVRRNSWYGYRIPLTLKDDAIWYPVNERGGRHLVVLGSTLILVGLLGLIFIGNEETQRDLLVLGMAVTFAGFGYSIWSCYAMARELDRAGRFGGK